MQEHEEPKFSLVISDRAELPHGSNLFFNLIDLFDPHEVTSFHISLNITRQRFHEATEAADIRPYMGRLMPHEDEPGIVDVAVAHQCAHELCECIKLRTSEDLTPRPIDDLDDEDCQAMLELVCSTISLDWKVVPDFIDEEFITANRPKIDRFLQPATDVAAQMPSRSKQP